MGTNDVMYTKRSKGQGGYSTTFCQTLLSQVAMATSALLAARIATRGCFLRSVRPQMLVAGEQNP